jgi:anti-anti-sigma factor
MPADPYGDFDITLTIAAGQQRADLVLSGEVDVQAGPQLADAVAQLTATTPHTIVVDLEAITYAGTVLLTFLTNVRNAVPADSDLLVCRPTPFTAKLLRIMEMDQIATIHGDLCT